MTAALITGGTRRIGRAIALRLARAGMDIVVASRKRDADAEETLALLRAAGVQALHAAGDLAREEDVASVFAAAASRFGRIGALVHAAGLRSTTALADISYAHWREIQASNLDAAFLCSRAALPHFPAEGGRIVFITGTIAAIGRPGRAHIAAAKAGTEGLARALAAELAGRGITVNCVSPGLVDTENTGTPSPEAAAAVKQLNIPAGRLARLEEIAEAVALLVSAQGAYITGQVMHVNGGLYYGG